MGLILPERYSSHETGAGLYSLGARCVLWPLGGLSERERRRRDDWCFHKITMENRLRFPDHQVVG